MPRKVIVEAVAVFPYGGRLVIVGDQVAMFPLEAAAAHRQGLVSITRPARGAPAATPEPEPPPAPETRRRYKRRDLQPE